MNLYHLKIVSLSTALSFLTFTAYAADLYVSPQGKNTNSGLTINEPLLTIQKAADLATAGTTVRVAPGVYRGFVQIRKSGLSTARIKFLSTVRGGAKIVPVHGVTREGIVWIQGSYIDVEGFEVDGESGTMLNGIIASGSNVIIKNNHVHHFGTNPNLCSSKGGSAINTHRYNGGVNNDIIGNVVHHIGTSTCRFIQGIYHSTTGTIKNNLVYKVGAMAIHLWHDARDIKIINNTVTESGYGIEVGAGDFYGPRLPADNVIVMNNIVYNNEVGVSEQGITGPNNKYVTNLVHNNRRNWDLDAGKTHTGTVAADPQFINASLQNYKIRSTSPAFNKGVVGHLSATDLDGLPRVSGGAPDIGAYEVQVVAISVPTITLQSQTITAGAKFNVSFSGVGKSINEYIALYKASAADSDYSYKGNWMKLNGSKTITPTTPISSGTVTFTAPLEPGLYNIRLFGGAEYANRLAVSPTITVIVKPAVSTLASK